MLTPQRNSQISAIRRSLKPQRLSIGLKTLCTGILIGVIPNLIATPQILPWAAPALGTLAFLGWMISVLLPQQSEIEIAIRSPEALRSNHDEELYARKGLIGFVSLYNNPGRLTPEELQTAIGQLDFDRLQLENSNLQPMLKAVQAHASQIQHCWLLATVGEKSPGSLPYATVIAEYLRQRRGLQCQFYYGEPYVVTLDDDTAVLSRTYDLLVKRVFRESARLGLTSQDLVADITAGFRSMTLGMVLACLDKERDIEFIGTQYREDGKPGKELTPIIFSFEPQMKSIDR